MDAYQICQGIIFNEITHNDNNSLCFTIVHSKMDRANIVFFPVVIIGVAGFIFLCFLYGSITTVISMVKGFTKQFDIVIIESVLFIIILISIIWSILKLKKIPKTEEVVITAIGNNLELKNSVRNNTVVYDLKNVKGAWMYEYYQNGTLMAVYIQLSQDIGKKKLKDKSPVISLPLYLSTSKKLKEIYLIILSYVEKKFSWITVGYNK